VKKKESFRVKLMMKSIDSGMKKKNICIDRPGSVNKKPRIEGDCNT
jgi:hypothetical protein